MRWPPDRDWETKERTTIYRNVDKVSYDNILDASYQNELIKKYLNDHYDDDPQVTEDLLTQIFDLNRKVNAKLDLVNKPRNVMWKPIKFEFSNMFSYGEDNVIDFTKMENLVGIFAPNTSGKSSLLDAIAFCFPVTIRSMK